MFSPRLRFFLIFCLCSALRWSPSDAQLPLLVNNVVSGAFDFGFDVATAACSALPISSSPPINESKLSFILMTPCFNYSYGTDQLEELYQNEQYDKTKKAIGIVLGWTNTPTDSKALDILTSAIKCRGDSNIILIDDGGYIDTSVYPVAASYVEGLGKSYAKKFANFYFIYKLFFETFYLIGHSMGAHICGFIGRYFTQFTGVKLPGIDALDAAKPCFKDGETVGIDGIKATDAVLVIALHTNEGQYGRWDPYGTWDYYPGFLSSVQKNCPVLPASCSHLRAVEIHAETICPGSENNFAARKCSDMNQLQNQSCNGDERLYGHVHRFNLTGIYASDVNGNEPFGLNATTKTQNCYHLSCRLCPSNN